MKIRNSRIVLTALLALSLMSFTALKEKIVNIDESTITWTGKKVTGQHEGTIALKSGILKFNGKTLTGGTFVIDMASIANTDMQGGGKGKLEGHLKSDDFFGVEKHPTATLEITTAEMQSNNNYAITGSLSIKGITNPIAFNMSVEKNTATALVKIDRTNYNIKYGSASFFDGLKDKAIYNDFDLNVTLKF
jgi:polyisoprenoid-binding protein YceI